MDPLSLAEVQERVCAAIQAHPDFWSDEGEQPNALSANLTKVRKTKTIAKIYDVLGLDTFEGY